MEKGIHLSVVIPAYNEEKRLPQTLETMLSYLEKQPFQSEILVVDDGSSDRTGDFARSILGGHAIPSKVLRNEPNRGKGYSVRRGLTEAVGRIRLFSDADLSTPIEEFEKVQRAIGEGADVAIGSRALRKSKVEVHQVWHREMMGKTFNLLVRLFAVRGIHDTQCGFKAFTDRFVTKVCPFLQVDGWAFDVEMLFLARRNGMKIAEVPVRWRNDANTRVNALMDSMAMFFELLRIRWMGITGKYKGLDSK